MECPFIDVYVPTIPFSVLCRTSNIFLVIQMKGEALYISYFLFHALGGISLYCFVHLFWSKASIGRYYFSGPWMLTMANCRWAYPVKCTNVILADDKETVNEVHVEYDRTKSTKPKVIPVTQDLVWYILQWTRAAEIA